MSAYRKIETRKEVYDTIRLCHFRQLLPTHLRHADDQHEGMKFAVMETSHRFPGAHFPTIELHSVFGVDAQGENFQRDTYWLCIGDAMADDTRCAGIFSDGTECERARMCQRYLLRDDLGPDTQTMRAVCLVNDGFFEKQVPVMRAAA